MGKARRYTQRHVVNCVVHIVVERWKRRLNHEGRYILIASGRLTDTRYTDDMML